MNTEISVPATEPQPLFTLEAGDSIPAEAAPIPTKRTAEQILVDGEASGRAQGKLNKIITQLREKGLEYANYPHAYEGFDELSDAEKDQAFEIYRDNLVAAILKAADELSNAKRG